MSKQNKKGKQEILSLNYLCRYIKQVLSFGSDVEFTSDKRNKDKILIRPALDDRMFVASIYDSPEETDKMLKIKNGEYSYISDENCSKSMYEFIFLDPAGSCSCQSPKMRVRLLTDHIYDRWNDWNSVYGIAAQSLVLLSKNPPPHLLDAFLTEYVQMVCLCIAQKASLIVFQKETADLSTQIEGNGNRIKLKTTVALMDIQERFSAFKSQLCYDEVTVQEQGIELYDMIKKFFLIDRELENVKDQIDGLHDATDTYLDLSFNKIGYIFTIIGALFAIIPMLPDAIGAYFDKNTPLDWKLYLFTFGVSIILGVICFSVIYFVYRRKRKMNGDNFIKIVSLKNQMRRVNRAFHLTRNNNKNRFRFYYGFIAIFGFDIYKNELPADIRNAWDCAQNSFDKMFGLLLSWTKAKMKIEAVPKQTEEKPTDDIQLKHSQQIAKIKRETEILKAEYEREKVKLDLQSLSNGNSASKNEKDLERSHRNDQRYFYDWETFRNVDELNQKLEKHLEWSNNKPMRTLGHKSPKQLLSEKLVA